jgi:methylated-DNA-[protein]-cysteine S-methyltransferase
MSANFYTLSSRLGYFGLIECDGLIELLLLGYGSQRELIRAAQSRLLSLPPRTDPPDWLAVPLIDYVDGKVVDLNCLEPRVDHLSEFAKKVVRETRSIGYGQTRTYGQLAAAVGSPGAARAVGQVMRANRTPLIIPCHRVVGETGNLVGFSVSGGLGLKKRLLEMEKG